MTSLCLWCKVSIFDPGNYFFLKKAWINCELRLSDQEKACKSESGGLEWCQQRHHSWAQRKNKDLRKTAMPRLRRVDLKLQGCAQPACISSILSWWAILLRWQWTRYVPHCSRLRSWLPVLQKHDRCARQFCFVWWDFHVWRWTKRKAVSNEPTYCWSPCCRQPVWHVYRSVLLQPVPDLINAGLSQERYQASNWGNEICKWFHDFYGVREEDEEERWMGEWLDGWIDGRVVGNRSNSIHMHICAIRIIKSLQGVIIFFSQCINSIFFTRHHMAPLLFLEQLSHLLWFISSVIIQYENPAVCYSINALGPYSVQTLWRIKVKKRSRSWWRLCRMALSQCTKVTEENKTAELPGGASPTHTLTHKCRYAAYSMRFTESSPPPHADTHLHTYTPPPPFVSIYCFLAPSHTDFLSGDPDQNS